MSDLTLSGLIKRYGSTQVIHGVDLNIEDGEFCVFVGPSGCGKSTLLRMVAGLEETTEGQISIGPRDVTHVDPAKRGVAMVFQTYALYPHMSVRDNMSFGLKMGGMGKAEIAKRVDAAAKILKLDSYMDRKPKALSGGQRQRVAIGRAIVREPEIFLFDEPLSNLDAELRVDMRVEIASLHKKLGATMIYVTHDQVEAMTMADKIVVLRDGIIEQSGKPVELYDDPDNLFVAGFIGSPRMNFFDGDVVRAMTDHVVVSIPRLGGVEVPLSVSDALATGTKVKIGIRPEHFGLNGPINAELQIDVVENLGGVSYAYSKSETDEAPVIVEWRGKDRPTDVSTMTVGFDPAEVLVFDSKTEKRMR